MQFLRVFKKQPWRILILIVFVALTAGRLAPGWFNRLTAMGAGIQEPIPIEARAALVQAPAAKETAAAADTTVDTQAEPASTAEGIDLSGLETYEGLPVGFTEEGYPFRGDPNAPITFMEYSDYLCPFCGRHFSQTLPVLLEQYGSGGQMLFVFRDFPIPALHPTAPAGHAAALCVAEQGAPLFWAMHDELFRTQQQWAGLRDPSEFVAELAAEVGADMDAYSGCLATGEKQIAANESTAAARALGFNGTPSFQVVSNRSGDVRDVVGALPVNQFTQLIETKLEELGESATQTVAASDAQASSDTEEVAAAADEIEAPAVPSLPPDLRVEGLETFEGLPVGFTEEGYPFRGDPEAPIMFIEYSDYLCPFCGRYFDQTLPSLLEQYAGTGQALFVFRDFPLVGLHPTAPVGHTAAVCVGEQGAPLFWAMHDELFRSQQQWANLPDPSDFVADLADQVGVDMDLYGECLAAGEMQTAVDESVAAASALGFNGTPSFQFVVNESGATHDLVGAHPVDEFSRWLDTLIQSGEPPEVEEPEPPELPLWANSEGLAPDPERPGYTLAGDPYKGNPEAPLVVVEFADFQCPACGQHALETQPALDEELIDTDEIMWVFKHLPLKEHAQAAVAAVAAECAGEQSQFWEMHHLLFEEQERWATDETATDAADADLLALAQELGLEMDAFSTCFHGRPALQRVLNDMYDAQGVVETTPTFIFLYGGKGSVSQGSRPADQFANHLRSRLEQAQSAE